MVNGLNATDKRYIYQFVSNVQLSGSKTFDSQILMHYFTQNNDVSIAKQFQKHLSRENRKHVGIDQVKYRKRASKIKWIHREYPVQDNADVVQKRC